MLVATSSPRWHSIRDALDRRPSTQRLAWLLLLSAVPGAIIGALFTSVIEDKLGDPILIGDQHDRVRARARSGPTASPASAPTDDFHRRDAVLMGIAQALALAPGVSRSGVTISAGRWLRFDRESAAQLSFLMSIPITGGAALYKGVEMFARRRHPAGFGGAFFWGIVRRW